MTLNLLKSSAMTLRAAWLALIMVASSQLVLAGHQFEHDGVTNNDVCATCVQLDQFDGPLASYSVSPESPDLPAPVVSGYQSVITTLPLASYSSRAPPLRG